VTDLTEVEAWKAAINDVERDMVNDTALAHAAIAALEKACADRERCGSCSHSFDHSFWMRCDHGAKLTGRFDRCHFTPSRWEICDG